MPHSRSTFVSSILLLLISYCLCPLGLAAQSILITDCQGFTRAARSVPSGTTTSVRVELLAVPAQGASEVVLTNIATSQAVSQSVTGSTIVFESVAPGAYTITTVGSDVTLAAVSIGSGVGIGAAALAVGGAAVVGGTATGVALDQSDVFGGGSSSGRDAGDGGSGPAPGGGNGSPDPAGPNPSPSASATPNPPNNNNGGGNGGGGGNNPPAATPTPEPCDCDPDERPKELDEDQFFADEDARKPSAKAESECLNGTIAEPISPFR